MAATGDTSTVVYWVRHACVCGLIMSSKEILHSILFVALVTCVTQVDRLVASIKEAKIGKMPKS